MFVFVCVCGGGGVGVCVCVDMFLGRHYLFSIVVFINKMTAVLQAGVSMIVPCQENPVLDACTLDSNQEEMIQNSSNLSNK